MADIKISELPVATVVNDADVLVINQGTTTKQATRALVNGNTVVSISGGATGLLPNTATSGTVTLSGTLLPANGGTGVTASSGANSVVLRDASQNINANSIIEGFSSVAASGTQITLTVASVPNYLVTGSGGQVIQLPNATTLQNGVFYSFNNNQSSGAISVNNNSGTLVASIPSGGFTVVSLLSNATAAGSWERHEQAPSNVTWSTNTLDYAGSITSATWNGNAVAPNRGGTGQSTYTDGQLLIGNSTGNTLAKATLTAGTNVTITNGPGTITIDATGAGGVSSFNAGTTGLTPSTATTGAVTLAGTLAIANGGTNAINGTDALANLGNTIFPVTARQTAAMTPASATATTMTFAVGAGIGGTVTIDGVTLAQGNTVLLVSQSPATQNGPWVITTLGTASVAAILTRPSWFTTGTAKSGTLCLVELGSTNTGFVLSLSGPLGTTGIVIGTSGITVSTIWGRNALATTSSNVFSGVQTLRANAAGAQNCPLFFQASSTFMATPIGNAVEWVNDQMYLTTAAGVRTTNTSHVAIPATATSTGQVGQIAVDNAGSWLYVCTATNVWKRVLLATF